MAEANPKVMEMVQAELKKNPDISNKELRDRAVALDKGIGKLSARQFNATYPLQVKRAMAPPRKRTAGGRKRKAGGKRSRAAGGAGSRGRKAAAGRSTAAGARAGAGAGAGADSAQRDQVRRVLVQLARDVAEGDRGALVEVAAGIDRYVERVLKATA